ncbi:MAG: mycofactocin biosynthesis FMN-dependent deaminase MftD [Pseudonocardia sp.]|nr:mycofactocin biosynthesis FMN-dependent deaminase MftD [Pseudonocardia sp.]
MASTSEWFETVAEAQRRAKKRLPKSVYMALIAGTDKGITLSDNVDAYSELGFRPHIANLPAERSQATTVLGQDIALPVIISPTGVQAVHPEGEVAVARAAAGAGTAAGLSSFASKSIEDVAAVNDKVFFQMYWVGSREQLLARAMRAKKAGAKALIMTLDWSFSNGRDWGSPPIPEKIDLKAAVQFAPEVLRKPRWLLDWVRSGAIPDLTTPNLAIDGEDAPTFFGAYYQWMTTPLPTWEDVAWLREQWGGPFMVKGIMHPDDARRAVDAGATAISVSNHGGNNLDGTPASVRVLPGIVDAVGDQIEVLLDGGIRRGSDVVKALALGARAVMIGRAYLWGMAANGEAGVANVLEIMKQGIDAGLLGLGKSSIHELTRDDLLIPEHFAVSAKA